MEPETMGTMEPEKKSHGALVGSVIVIVILVIGGLYLWGMNKDALAPLAPQVTGTDATVTDTTLEDETLLDELDADLGGLDTTLDADLEAVN